MIACPMLAYSSLSAEFTCRHWQQQQLAARQHVFTGLPNSVASADPLCLVCICHICFAPLCSLGRRTRKYNSPRCTRPSTLAPGQLQCPHGYTSTCQAIPLPHVWMCCAAQDVKCSTDGGWSLYDIRFLAVLIFGRSFDHY